MKKMRMILIAALATMMLAGISFASSETTVPSFEKLDTNCDNLISKLEAMGSEDVAKLFEKADVNEDRMLTEGEFAYLARWTAKSVS